MTDMRKLFTLKQAEELTGRKVSTWRRDILLRRIDYVKLGRQVRIPSEVIAGLVEDGYRPAIRPLTGEQGPTVR